MARLNVDQELKGLADQIEKEKKRKTRLEKEIQEMEQQARQMMKSSMTSFVARKHGR